MVTIDLNRMTRQAMPNNQLPSHDIPHFSINSVIESSSRFRLSPLLCFSLVLLVTLLLALRTRWSMLTIIGPDPSHASHLPPKVPDTPASKLQRLESRESESPSCR